MVCFYDAEEHGLLVSCDGMLDFILAERQRRCALTRKSFSSAWPLKCGLLLVQKVRIRAGQYGFCVRSEGEIHDAIYYACISMQGSKGMMLTSPEQPPSQFASIAYPPNFCSPNIVWSSASRNILVLYDKQVRFDFIDPFHLPCRELNLFQSRLVF